LFWDADDTGAGPAVALATFQPFSTVVQSDFVIL
jgi:hypothetical protein